jgi:anti-sigma factor RsiW
MTVCVRYGEALLECALGGPASPEFSAHLTACTACSAALDEARGRASVLDAGLGELVVHEPSPNLRPRILARINSQRTVPSWPWRLGAAAIAAIAIVSLVVMTRDLITLKNTREQSRAIASVSAELSHWRAPTDVLLDLK